MFGVHRHFPTPGGGSTADATAEQWDIKNGKTAYIASGKVTGSGYFPAMMDYDGSSGYYSLSADLDVTAGWTVFGRFRWDGGTITSAGGINRPIMWSDGSSGNTRVQIAIINDQIGDDRAGVLHAFARNSAGTQILSIHSNTVVSDGGVHSFFASYDPAAGTAQLYVDGAEDQNTGAADRTLTTGSMPTGIGDAEVGSRSSLSRFFNGLIGPLGLRGAYLTNWSDFMQADGTPKLIVPATAFGATPLLYHESGKMDEHVGSAAAMTKNGTITLAAASSWS